MSDGLELDRFELARFRDAQDRAGTYQTALAELRAGRKATHWIWFVFPQLAGLGRSPVSQRYAIASLEEARAYLADPVLGSRLRECCAALLSLTGPAAGDPVAVLGDIDALKLRSSMTLFARADPSEPVFAAVLRRYFGGVHDPVSTTLLGP